MEIHKMNLQDASTASKAKNNPKALADAATEVEALFINELLKVMRQNTPSMSENGLGSEVYTGMFDTELSKVLAQRGVGFKEPLMEQLKRASMEARPPASMGSQTPASKIDNFDAALGVASKKVK